MSGSGTRPVGLLIGSLVGTVFGLVFVVVNSAELPGAWPLGVRVGGVVVAAVLLAGILRAGRLSRGEEAGDHRGFVDRRYWNIVGIEAVALVAGLFVINQVLHRPSVAVAWIAVVVGVHFVGLGKLWHLGQFFTLGLVMTALGLVGFVLGGLQVSAGAIGLVAGVGSGVALFVTVAVSLARAGRTPAGSPAG
ncbi:hypothetical protein [Actinophytocola sp.]|uniref:hypothetical protein n=1 Tax=Actinophytocola sp. TaxID=1872138 RepID=UPI002ED900A5